MTVMQDRPAPQTVALKCEKCRSARFVVLRVGGQVMLKCVNCHEVRPL